MATQLQIRRGTAAQVAAFTGAEGEIVYNSTNDSLHTNDGATAGGFELARADLNNVLDADLNAALTGNTLSALTITTLTAGAGTFSGNVGIGITPSKKLTVFGTGVGNATVQIEGEGGADPYINFLTNNTQHWSLGVDDSDADKFKLSEHSALGINDYLTVDVTGNVGIGTSSPNVNLEILSGGTFTGAIRVGDSGSSRRLILEQTDVLTYTIGGTGTSSVTRFVSGGSSGIGTERMRLDASGNLGIGSVPDAWKSTWSALDIGDSGSLYAQNNNTTGLASNLYYNGVDWVHKNTGATAFYQQSEGAHYFYSNASQAAGSTFSPASKMTINASGNLGIGVSAPNEKLESSGAIRVLGTTATSRNSGTLSFNGTLFNIESRGPDVSNRGTIGFYQATSSGASAIQSMLLDASGNLLLGTSAQILSGKQNIEFNGSVNNGLVLKTTRVALNSTFAAFINVSGSICGSIIQNGTTTVHYSASSDRRLKENIADSDDSGSVIDAIQVRKFDWIGTDEHERFGFIAQELQEVFPVAVCSMGMADEEDPMLGVDPSKLMALAIKEIQSLRARIAILEGAN